MQQHGAALAGIRQRHIQVANMDPAADAFEYEPSFDIRELISVPDVMTELNLGPNGGLLYAMEYLLENLDWLRDHLENCCSQEDDYLLIDCPGQIELYTHVPIMRNMINAMKMWGYSDSIVSVCCIDATFLTDTSKFLSGSLLSLTTMLALELPHINVLTKCDLMSAEQIESILDYGSAIQLWDLDQDNHSLMRASGISEESSSLSARRLNHYISASGYETDESNRTTDSKTGEGDSEAKRQQRRDHIRKLEERRRRRGRLTTAICQILDDYQMVNFIPLNRTDEDSIDHVLATVDHSIQYGEDLDVKSAHLD
jgi:GPN-loop GTPase